MQLRHRISARSRHRLAKVVAAGSVAALALNGGAADATDGCTSVVEAFPTPQWVCDTLIPGGYGVYVAELGYYYVGTYNGCITYHIRMVCEVTISMSES